MTTTIPQPSVGVSILAKPGFGGALPDPVSPLCPSCRRWRKQLSFMLPNKSTDNVFLHLFSFPSPEAAALLCLKLV